MGQYGWGGVPAGEGRGKCERTLLPSLPRANSRKECPGSGFPPHSLSHSSGWTHSGLPLPSPKHRRNQRGRGERQKSGTRVHEPWGWGRREGGALRLPQDGGRTFSHTPSGQTAGLPELSPLCLDPSEEITGGELRGATVGPVTAPRAFPTPPPRPRTRRPVSAPSGRAARRGTEGAELEEP